MKKQRLLENDGLPNFTVATGITIFIIIFSLVTSFITVIFSSLFSDSLMMSIWGLFSSSFLTGLLLWFIFANYRTYVVTLLQSPFNYFFRGLYYYITFIPIFLGITLFSFFIFKILGLTPTPQEIILICLRTDSFYLLFIIFFLSCIVAPFAEEIIFRGIVYPGFKSSFSTNLSMIISSIIFALLHNDFFVLPGLFVFGLFLSYLFEKYKNLWLSISVHFFNNFFTTIFILMVKYIYPGGDL